MSAERALLRRVKVLLECSNMEPLLVYLPIFDKIYKDAMVHKIGEHE